MLIVGRCEVRLIFEAMREREQLRASGWRFKTLIGLPTLPRPRRCTGSGLLVKFSLDGSFQFVCRRHGLLEGLASGVYVMPERRHL